MTETMHALSYERTVAIVLTCAIAACAPSTPTAPPALPEQHHEHELHLPPVGSTVHVTLDGKSADVLLASVPHEGASLQLAQLWKTAWPTEDATALHFDLTGSDGFHPASRPPCTRLLSFAEVQAAHIDVVSHDISFDGALQLPGCYRVKAVVSMDGLR